MKAVSDDVEVEVWCGIGLVGCKIRETVEVAREEWESMSDEDREESCKDIAFDSFDWGWNEVSEDD